MIFPYVLVRLSSVNYSTNEISKSFAKNLQQLRSNDEQLRVIRERLKIGLYERISHTEDIDQRKLLLKLKRKIDKGTVEIDDLKLIRNIDTFVHSVTDIVIRRNINLELKEQVKFDFYQMQEEERHRLIQNTCDENFMKALILASPSIYEELERYTQKESPRLYNKTDISTEISIQKYLLRSKYKTSPFSSFTFVGIGKLQDESAILISGFNQEEVKSHIRLNNYIFRTFKDIIKNNSNFNPYLQVNPSVTIKDSKCFFFININNYETFCEIKSNSLTNILLEYNESSNGFYLNEVINYLLTIFDSSYGDILAKITNLIECGFLLFSYGVNELSAEWTSDLLNFISANNLTAYGNLKSFILKANELSNLFGRSESRARRSILSDLGKSFNHALDVEYQMVSQLDVFKEGKKKHVPVIENQKLLLEDVVALKEFDIDKHKVEDILCDFDKLLARINFETVFQRDLDIIKERFISLNISKISLLDFFYEFNSFIKEEHKKSDTQTMYRSKEFITRKERFSTWCKSFNKTLSLNIENHVVGFNLYHIDLANEDAQLLPKSMSNTSFGAFIQFAQHSGQDVGILNSVVPGYGKLASRFLDYFSPIVAETFYKWNTQGAHDSIFAEVLDSSCFNANIHPKLVDFEIEIPGCSTTGNGCEKINLKDIFLVSGEDGYPYLCSNKGAKIRPFDLGFQHIDGRSDLYYFLNIFSETPGLNVRLITSSINDYYAQQQRNTLVTYPRIVFQEKIVIQRQFWAFKVKNYPFLVSNLSEFDYYLQIQSWLEATKLPSNVFISINPFREVSKDKTSLKKDDYKPQFINFYDALHVNIFRKLIRRADKEVHLVEVFPSEDNNLTERTMEFLFHWYN